MEREKQWISSENLFDVIKEMIDSGLPASFTVTGMSMWPLICHGRDQVVVESFMQDDIRAGSIVLFRTSEGKYLLHRITKIRGSNFEATGDGNFFRDGWFPRSCIIAHVTKIIRPDRVIDCSHLPYRICSRLWMLMYPVRQPLFTIWKYLRRYLRR